MKKHDLHKLFVIQGFVMSKCICSFHGPSKLVATVSLNTPVLMFLKILFCEIVCFC